MAEFSDSGAEVFALDQGELLVGLGVGIVPDEMGEALAAAARTAPGRPDDPRNFPVWTALTTDTLPLQYRDDVRQHRQLVMSADMAYVLLGALQAWCERARGQLPIGVADQMDALRADSRKRWKQTAAAFDRARDAF